MLKRKYVILCLSGKTAQRLPKSWLRYARIDELTLDSRDPGYSMALTGAGREVLDALRVVGKLTLLDFYKSAALCEFLRATPLCTRVQSLDVNCYEWGGRQADEGLARWTALRELRIHSCATLPEGILALHEL